MDLVYWLFFSSSERSVVDTRPQLDSYYTGKVAVSTRSWQWNGKVICVWQLAHVYNDKLLWLDSRRQRRGRGETPKATNGRPDKTRSKLFLHRRNRHYSEDDWNWNRFTSTSTSTNQLANRLRIICKLSSSLPAQWYRRWNWSCGLVVLYSSHKEEELNGWSSPVHWIETRFRWWWWLFCRVEVTQKQTP